MKRLPWLTTLLLTTLLLTILVLAATATAENVCPKHGEAFLRVRHVYTYEGDRFQPTHTRNTYRQHVCWASRCLWEARSPILLTESEPCGNFWHNDKGLTRCGYCLYILR